MLGKLLKHEFMETYKIMAVLNIILLGLSGIGMLLIGTKISPSNDTMQFLAASSAMIYFLAIFAVFIITIVFITIRFYKTVYSVQGYLTHSLPVSSSAILNSKLLVSGFWLIITACITVISFFLLFRVALGSSWDSIALRESFQYLLAESGLFMPEIILYVIVAILISTFSVILMIFASLSVGQLFQQHRITASIVAYVVFYLIGSVLSTITLIVLRFNNMYTFSSNTYLYPRGLWISLLESFLYSIFFYFTCYYIINKKLNLE